MTLVRYSCVLVVLVHRIYVDIRQRPHVSSRQRLLTCTDDFTDILKSPSEYPSCECDEYILDLIPHNNNPLTFTRLAAPVLPTFETFTPSPPLPITALDPLLR